MSIETTFAAVGQFVVSTALLLWSALVVSSAWLWSVLAVSSAWLWSAILGLSPAFWSAVAASFSAISSFLMLVVQRRNRFDAARPELVLTGWTRSPGADHTAVDIITIQAVRNVGRGPALNIKIDGTDFGENAPTVVMSTVYVPIIAPADAHDLGAPQGEMLIWWKNIPRADDGTQILSPSITLSCTDALNLFWYETEYRMLVVPLSRAPGAPIQGTFNPIAPGVGMLTRRTKATSLRRLRYRGRRRRFVARVKEKFLQVFG